VTDQIVAQAAKHWDAVSRDTPPLKLRWWQHERVLLHINRLICGVGRPGPVGGDALVLSRLGGSERFGRALSIGCGNGTKELSLCVASAVDRFDLFEISPERVSQGRRLIEASGLQSRVVFHQEVVRFDQRPTIGPYDLIYWNNALHHMLDVAAAIDWSLGRLRPGGCVYINDFVGPDRMQYSDEMLSVASRVRASLPERLLQDPRRPGSLLPREVARPDPVRLIASDPTECADSSSILPSVARLCPEAHVTLTGGAIYHLALNDVLHNLVPGDDDALLDALLLADELLAREGMTHYASIVIERG
jgi:SAM-dependent methyltransferase